MSSFHENSLNIGIFVRDTEPGTYHWCLYMHHTGSTGKKYHIRNLGSGWLTEFGILKSALKEMLLIGYVRIASIPPEKQAEADRLIESTPINREGVTCRTWLLEALGSLVSAGIVVCSHLEELEEEVRTFGAANFSEAGLKTINPPIVDSTVCKL